MSRKNRRPWGPWPQEGERGKQADLGAPQNRAREETGTLSPKGGLPCGKLQAHCTCEVPPAVQPMTPVRFFLMASPLQLQLISFPQFLEGNC